MQKTTKFLAALCIASLATTAVFAQVKVGANPTVIGSNSNLEVEATNGIKTVVKKDNGMVGIGTDSPANRLEINEGATGNSGLRFTQINNTTSPVSSNVAPIGVNANGDVVVMQKAASSGVYRGNVAVGDITNNSGPLTVTGYITSAVKTGALGGGNLGFVFVDVNFPSIQTSDYSVALSVEQIGATAYGNSLLNQPVIYNKTDSSFRIYLNESVQIAQGIQLNVIIVK